MTPSKLTKQDVERALDAYLRDGLIRGYSDVEEQSDGSVTYRVNFKQPLPRLVAFPGDVSGETINLIRALDAALIY